MWRPFDLAGASLIGLQGVVVPSPDVAWTAGAIGRTAYLSDDTWHLLQEDGNYDYGGVAATGLQDAWAVGRTNSGGYVFTEHWDGSAWTPYATSIGGALHDAVAIATNDVWAVGESDGRNLIRHWDGALWRTFAAPDPGTTSNALFAVAATSRTDAWAAGYASSSGVPTQPVILHWNGIKWKQETLPFDPNGGILYDVSASSASEAWAVGYTGGGGTASAFHWDGSVWTQISAPGDALYGVARGMFAVGRSGGAATIDAWDGGAWDWRFPILPRPRHTSAPSQVMSAPAGSWPSEAWGTRTTTTRLSSSNSVRWTSPIRDSARR